MLVFMEMFCRWYFHHGNNLAVETLLHRSLWIVGQLAHGHPGWHSHCEQWQATMADWAGEGVCITPHLLGIFPINCHTTGEDKRFLLQHWIFQFRLSILRSEVEPLLLKSLPGTQNSSPFFRKGCMFFSFSFFSVLHNVGISQTTLVLRGTCCSPCSRKMVLVMRRGGLNPISSENCGKIDLCKLKILK